MNLDELQSVQARERQSSDLQHLRSSFYREVGEFIGELNDERARAVDAAEDPFSEPAVRRLTDDIETAEGTVEAIYERRVGKVVKKASIAAAGMPVQEDGLTTEEETLFSDLVTRIEENRKNVLSVLDGEMATVTCSINDNSDPDPAADDGVSDGRTSEDSPSSRNRESEPASGPKPSEDEAGVSAADLMGTGTNTETEAERADAPQIPTEQPSESTSDSASSSPEDSPPDVESRPSPSGDEPEKIVGVPRTTVRITADVGEIVGADDRDYDLGTEDVVTLPVANADVLVEKNAAERL